ncbi:hypothetical protein [Neisseria meningitidis]|uniref:hypothetical protein n=1 Tax=Neisseria meningitidis TaxID=487 RepID=UPI001867CB34|nr:hypothetical protein [Neisseria meningitidis]
MLSTRKTARKIQARHIALPFSGKPQFYRPQERLSKQAQATPPGHFPFSPVIRRPDYAAAPSAHHAFRAAAGGNIVD